METLLRHINCTLSPKTRSKSLSYSGRPQTDELASWHCLETAGAAIKALFLPLSLWMFVLVLAS